MRIYAANLNANTTKGWLKWINFINTGTYNTQWMIFDLEKARNSNFTLPPQTFLLAEQVPGKILSADLSEKLSKVAKIIKIYRDNLGKLLGFL